jgi:hypothetical protein
VIVQPGGTLIDRGASIGHDLKANQPVGIGVRGGSIGHDVQIDGVQGSGPGANGDNYLCDALIGHDVQIKNGAAGAGQFVIGDAPDCYNDPSNTIGHDLQVQNNANPVDVSNNGVGHDLHVQGNGGGTDVAYNQAGHAAQCQNNAAPLTGLGNSAPLNQGCVNHCPTYCVVFVQQPSNGTQGNVITSSSSGPVTAEVIDSSGNVVNTSTPITVAVLDGPGTLSSATSLTQTAVNGVASFSDLKLDQGGVYVLQATASDPAVSPGNSAPFNETAVSTCSDSASCNTEIDTPASDFAVEADPFGGSQSGTQTLTETVDAGTPLHCPGATQQDPNWWEFVITGANSTAYSKTIIYTLNQFLNPSMATVNSIQFCFGAPYEFTTSSGGPAPAGTLPDGSQGFIGLLPDCPRPTFDASTAASTSSGPCVASRSGGGSSDEGGGSNSITLVVDIPAGLPGDPWGRSA